MKRTRVLVIADEPTICEDTTLTLSGAGFDVVEAHSGARGAQIAIAERPDAIIIDLRLRGGAGRLALSFLRKSFRTSHIPLILLDERHRIRQEPRGVTSDLPRVPRRPLEPSKLLWGLEQGLAGAA